jgi:hypothetical protein
MIKTIRSAILAASLALPSAAPTTARAAAGAFFRPAPDLAGKRSPDQLYPQGRIFPVGFYGLKLDERRPEGLTLIGPYGREENVEAARRTGLKCTYSISLPMEFHSATPLALSPEEIRARIRAQVEAVTAHPEIGWWYLAPEELRHWRKNEMAYLETAADAIRRADPLRRPVWMYDPGHRDAAGLAHTVRHLDVCGKGLYTNYSGQRDNRVWVRWSIEQELDAIAKANRAAIPIAVPEMFQQPPDDLLPMIPKWVRHDVYLSLITGAKGIVIFSGWRRPNFAAFDAYLDAYARCIRELNGPLGLGQVFLFGERRDDIRVRIVRGPAHVSTAHKEPVRFPSVAALDVALGADRFLLLVNSSNEPVRVSVGGLPRAPISARNLFEENADTAIRTGRWELDLAALEVQAFRFAPAE